MGIARSSSAMAAGVVTYPDPADPPRVGQCASAFCQAGDPVVQAEAIGTACDENGGIVCNGDATDPQCVGCNEPADCVDLPEDDECQMRTCVDHVCGQDFTAAGTAVALQTPGDCREMQCDGTGGVVSANDDSDTPDDLNDCTTDSCFAGAPRYTDAPATTACGDGTLTCDGAGQCTGCTAPSQCGSDSFCATNTCDTGVCGLSYTANGTIAPGEDPTPGDCQARACDGNGQLVPIMDDSDLPMDDGNECTDQVCVDGAAMFPPSALDTPCAMGGAYLQRLRRLRKLQHGRPMRRGYRVRELRMRG